MNFKFLWWFKLVAFFPGDMMRELKELGADDCLAYMISHNDAVKQSDVVTFANDWISEPVVFQYFEKYIEIWNKLEEKN